MDLGLKDKVAVITGGSLGIGLAVARGMAAEGVHLALCARDEPRIRAVAGDINSQYGVRCIGVEADVSRADDIRRFVAEVEAAFGGTDILAGSAQPRLLSDIPHRCIDQ